MKRRYQAGIIMMLISAMIASNLPMTTVFAAAKKQQVKQETKKLEEHHLVPLGTFSRDYKTMEKDERSNKRSIFNSPLNFAYITKDSNKAIGNTSIDQYVKIVDQDSALELHLDSLQSGQQLLNKENLEKALANRLIHIKKDINKRIQNNM